MPELATRPAVTTDVPALAHVHRLSRALYYGTTADADDNREEMWAHFLGQPARITHVTEESGVVVGLMSAARRREPEPALELTALYVLPTRVGHGIGGRLHERFEGERHRDEPGVLEVWAGNDHAIRFYGRRGWIATSTTRPGPDGVDFVTYRLPGR